MNPALDRLDDLDKRIVVALQRDGRATWRAIADAVGASVTTVARRGQQMFADGIVKVAVVPSLGAGGQYDTMWARINCRPGMHLAVAAQLVGNPDVRFCSVVTGGYDIMAELVVRGGPTQYPQLLETLHSIEGVERWRSDLIMHVYKVSFGWGRQLYEELLGPDVEDIATEVEPAECSPDHFDNADLDILAALLDDGRETFQSVADRLGINESSVRRRFERMRATRCLDILTLVPSAALGMGAETLMTVKVSPSRLEAVAQELARYPFVRFLATMLDDNSLLCEVIAPSVSDLYSFINGSLAVLDGVEGWTASMELLYLKRGFIETPWWRSQVGSAVAPPV